MKKTISEVISHCLKSVMEEQEATVPDDFDSDSILLESGLDSLGFAILVSELEGELGYDPFVLMDVPVYPSTYGEFVAVYESYSSHRE